MPQPKRLGMLVPSSNTVLEPATALLLPADGSVTMHVSRLRVVSISAEPASLAQFDLDHVLRAAELLADALVDLMVWNGTSASWLGFQRDRRLAAAVETHTGVPTTTALLAVNTALARLDARRIGLVTPYIAAIESRIMANYAASGITVAAAVRSNLTDNIAYGRISPGEISTMVRNAARTPVDAIVILCTNLAGAAIAPGLTQELDVPVLDSVRVAIEHSLSLIA